MKTAGFSSAYLDMADLRLLEAGLHLWLKFKTEKEREKKIGFRSMF